MKLTKLALAALVASFSGSAFAQYEGTSWEQRIGTGQDSIDTRQNLSIFQMSYENKEWQEAYTAWKAIIEKAPCAQKGVYTKGAFVLYNLIALENQKEKAQQDSLKKIQYFNDLMMLFDTRAKNLDALNSFEAEKGRSTLGDVLSLKADYYNWTAPTVAGCGYTLNKSYDNYSQAIKMINEKGGREIEGSMLQNFFLVSDAMYKSNPNAMRERYLQDYLDSKDACEKMLQLAKEAQAEGDTTRAEQLLQKYDGPLAFIEQTFTQSGAADREQIINVYTKKLDSYKEATTDTTETTAETEETTATTAATTVTTATNPSTPSTKPSNPNAGPKTGDSKPLTAMAVILFAIPAALITLRKKDEDDDDDADEA